jgi:hypothetical protein
MGRNLHEELKFDYLIRFRGNIAVTSAERETRPARLRMPRHERKPCSGCGFAFMIASNSAIVAGPIFSASRNMRDGDHSERQQSSARHGWRSPASFAN